jgi:hypothetical protein
MLKRIVVLALLFAGLALTARAELETAFTFDYDAADQASARAIASAGRAGAAQARADIAAGRFYIIQYGEPVDQPSFPVVPRDEATGFVVLSLHNCEATPAFEAQAKAYNDTMRQWRHEHSPKTSNQAMQRTAGRLAFYLSMTSTFNLQRRSPSSAVADLVSR